MTQKTIYIAFVGEFYGQIIYLPPERITGCKEDDLQAKWEHIQGIVGSLAVVDRECKGSLTVIVYDAGKDKRIVVAECLAGGWVTAAYVTQQVGGTINPSSTDVKIMLRPQIRSIKA